MVLLPFVQNFQLNSQGVVSLIEITLLLCYEVFKIDDFWEVDKTDFTCTMRLLASRYPLVTVMVPGKLFDTRAGQDFYNPPLLHRLNEAGKSKVIHAVVLIRAGRYQGVNYYWIFNSCGDAFADHGKIRMLVDGVLTNPIGVRIASPVV